MTTMNNNPTPSTDNRIGPSVAAATMAVASVLATDETTPAPEPEPPTAPKCEHCDVEIRTHGDKGYCPQCGRVMRELAT